MKRYRGPTGLVVGVISCMAERSGEKFVEGPHGVDVVAGPDVCDLPRLARSRSGRQGRLMSCSRPRTYAEIAPACGSTRNGVSAFVAIMRGCNNFSATAWCPIPAATNAAAIPKLILAGGRTLFGNGYREVTLLGQNVNSYRFGEVDFPA